MNVEETSISDLSVIQKHNLSTIFNYMSLYRIIPNIEARIISVILEHPNVRATELAKMIGVSYAKMKSFLSVYLAEAEEDVPEKCKRAISNTDYLIYYPVHIKRGYINSLKEEERDVLRHIKRKKFFSISDRVYGYMKKREYKIGIPMAFRENGVLSEEVVTPEVVSKALEASFIEGGGFDFRAFYFDIHHHFSGFPPLFLPIVSRFVMDDLVLVASEENPDAKYRFDIMPEIDLNIVEEENQVFLIRKKIRDHIKGFSGWGKKCFDYEINRMRDVVYKTWRSYALTFYADMNQISGSPETWTARYKQWAGEFLPEKYDPGIDYFSEEYKNVWFKVLDTVASEKIPFRSLMPLYLMGENPYNPSTTQHLKLLDEAGAVDPYVKEFLRPRNYSNFRANFDNYLQTL